MTVTSPIRLLNLGVVDSWQTQAIYHALAEMMTAESPDTIIICQPQSPYLCLGYHQIYENTFDRARCEQRNLPVLGIPFKSWQEKLTALSQQNIPAFQ